MTGGQMAPTTLVGQKTTTSPLGRDPEHCGKPIRIAEMLSTIEGSAFIARCSLDSTPHINQTKAAIKKAFQAQIDRKGFSMVEILSPCPTNWGKAPVEAMEWLKDNMIPYYPLGTFKEV
jgi:2-oxoglutarate ferredoxin oxidoreductase subunit beta